jgi:2-succinyl-6-hydroxy-2,4-cyclohexadiene-1-carboxylate synthase
MIHVFHGFLGSPVDFEFLKSEDVQLHDLYHQIPKTSSQDTLIGYSMGGRLAMELARKNGFEKLILINAHPGLQNDEEREVRSQWEEEVLERLTDPQTFLKWWNALPLFQNDRPLGQVPDGSDVLFKRMLLSRQENFLPFLQDHKESVHWILGESDPKYSALATKLKDFNVHMIPGGHRLFQHPEALGEALKKILE